ncbi:hypothetical protein BO70DRAFT_433299 [Aspergillus heteromorphus CBS 117.55]|uniref:Uncharacterized protein n=1 Tax=Aspergillus heteromorphus CBS 117.55 TaxID=1448321 RepID=A0A317UWF0_9EURO|nr:uncharacterized protein BO70DRAFT_433299 [Aspergillus heteromorphus CBS 117.55]PWY65711.1 hypothetical protein BO70DRAFT_433299 [Aspergillus heteromorphus CBS 117.55]
MEYLLQAAVNHIDDNLGLQGETPTPTPTTSNPPSTTRARNQNGNTHAHHSRGNAPTPPSTLPSQTTIHASTNKENEESNEETNPSPQNLNRTHYKTLLERRAQALAEAVLTAQMAHSERVKAAILHAELVQAQMAHAELVQARVRQAKRELAGKARAKMEMELEKRRRELRQCVEKAGDEVELLLFEKDKEQEEVLGRIKKLREELLVMVKAEKMFEGRKVMGLKGKTKVWVTWEREVRTEEWVDAQSEIQDEFEGEMMSQTQTRTEIEDLQETKASPVEEAWEEVDIPLLCPDKKLHCSGECDCFAGERAKEVVPKEKCVVC